MTDPNCGVQAERGVAMASPAASDPYEAIRPYRDDEVRPTLARLLADPDLLAAVAAFSLPRAVRIAPALVRSVVAARLRRRLRGVDSVRAFQQFLEQYFVRMIQRTTDGFSYAGIESLQPGRGYLFVGNHRDIALDSGFLNYALWRSGHDTVRIAIGDNLLRRPVATDLMRLNKSFIVRRNLSGPKEMLAAYSLTSSYLHHSIAEDASVWIAQREGRAKDGWDRTDPAIVKMFVVSRRKGREPFGQLIGNLRIVPVAVSYELDPCDLMKAHELAVAARDGHYEKPADEDLRSILRGITGYKGRVHVGFGTPLGSDFADADAVAAEIDAQIRNAYRLWPTHAWAARLTGTPMPPAHPSAAPAAVTPAVRHLAARLRGAPPAERAYLACQYANPVRQQQGLPRLDASDIVLDGALAEPGC
jgi:1-acyl-sn-glycerol-3-phosphate acyltransferase